MSADFVTLLLLPAVAVYALAAIAAWLVATTRAHGVVYAPGKLFGVYRPAILALLTGFLPAAIVAAVLIPRLPGRPWIGLAIFAAGLAITGALIHRDLLARVGRPRIWNAGIAAVTLLGLAAAAWLALGTSR